jgi:hypothetical protein
VVAVNFRPTVHAQHRWAGIFRNLREGSLVMPQPNTSKAEKDALRKIVEARAAGRDVSFTPLMWATLRRKCLITGDYSTADLTPAGHKAIQEPPA